MSFRLRFVLALALCVCAAVAHAETTYPRYEVIWQRTVSDMSNTDMQVGRGHTPLVHRNGYTFFVWIGENARPFVTRLDAAGNEVTGMVADYAILDNDPHNVFSIAVDGDGYIHTSGDMHHYALHANSSHMPMSSTASTSATSSACTGSVTSRGIPRASRSRAGSTTIPAAMSMRADSARSATASPISASSTTSTDRWRCSRANGCRPTRRATGATVASAAR